MRYAGEVPHDDLYIPHGSDESLQYLRDRKIKYLLYIPHGSDESFLCSIYAKFNYALYPTWFR